MSGHLNIEYNKTAHGLCRPQSINFSSVSSNLQLVIEQERQDGIFLTILGFGQGNIKDEKMSAIANNGNAALHLTGAPRLTPPA